MRLSAVLLLVACAGLIGGAWLVGLWAVGVAVMFESVGLALWALTRDVPKPSSMPEPIERWRRSA